MICVIMPTYNEAENIGTAIAEVGRALSGIPHKIIVVDDASPDGTADVARRLGAHVLVRRGRRGAGTAVLDGLREAGRLGCAFAAVVDADLQHDVAKLGGMYELLMDGADLVVGSRYLPGGGIEGGLSLPRRIVSKGAELYVHLLLPRTRGLTDAHGNFFAVRLDAVSDLDVRVVGRAPEVLPLLIQRLRPGARVVEVPYIFRRRRAGKSKLGPAAVTAFMATVLLASPLLPLAAAGALGIAANMAVLAAALSAGLPQFAASGLAVEASILSNFFTADALLKGQRGVARIGGLLRYHAAVGLGAAVQYAAAVAAYHLLAIPAAAAQLIGIAAGFVANYYASTEAVWRQAIRRERP